MISSVHTTVDATGAWDLLLIRRVPLCPKDLGGLRGVMVEAATAMDDIFECRAREA
ncbi:hypothetical protein SaccyDRAFT_3208 [Saccharomonospora cyanea NA-134]|uniref:Uncharacterized protein n=1 Tax=Saccharomonospora cyanea NA-134 TaxID=882082 RepID=H5XM02_9PSEU|nr:hypothetical protein SaccyDRAFT_3208 [Saccharomonospora cyanea NA-134]